MYQISRSISTGFASGPPRAPYLLVSAPGWVRRRTAAGPFWALTRCSSGWWRGREAAGGGGAGCQELLQGAPGDGPLLDAGGNQGQRAEDESLRGGRRRRVGMLEAGRGVLRWGRECERERSRASCSARCEHCRRRRVGWVSRSINFYF